VKRKTAGKARTVARGHTHVKPASAHGKAATGHAHKHHKAAKHHAAAHKHKGTVARGLAPDAVQVASCAAEALAASLRHLQLPGLSVTSADVLGLHRAAGADDEAGVPVLALLEAASAAGLAGVRPVSYSPVINYLDSRYPSGVILGVDLPGPHTVLATPEGWWSWGELWCPWCEFPDAVIEEAWEVAWL
jgi:hypothetical protein